MAILALHPMLFAVLLCAVPISDNPALGIQIILRLTFYYLFGVLFVVWLNTIDFEEVKHTLSKAIFYVLAVFSVVFGYYVIVSGTNILSVFTDAVSSGNPNFIQYHLFVTVMNKGNLEGLSAEESIDAAGRHGIMIFLIIMLFARILLPKTNESKSKLILGKLLGVFVVLFVFVSLSRVALLILICATLMYFVHRLILMKISTLSYWILAAVVTFGVTYLSFTEGGRILTLLNEKLIVDVVNNPRVFEFLQIIDLINKNAIIGAGTGTELELFGLRAKFSHNIILFSWHQAGVFGLIVSIVTLFTFIAFCLRLWYLSIKSTDILNRQLHLLAGILFVPAIIRMLVAKQGALALTEWLSVGIALAICNFALKQRPEAETRTVVSSVEPVLR